ncbi:hypothetical protein NVP1081O_224 [Vibrio phage 1.081.O._10N.286.52.C2]|nr:hypothetical protein NVP1081O_224 [Vibrio phage 1.081.O._10N.286.52.C2]
MKSKTPNRQVEIVQALAGIFAPSANEIAQYLYQVSDRKTKLTSIRRSTNKKLNDGVLSDDLSRFKGAAPSSKSCSRFTTRAYAESIGINSIDIGTRPSVLHTGNFARIRTCLSALYGSGIAVNLSDLDGTVNLLLAFIETSSIIEAQELRQCESYKMHAKLNAREVVRDQLGRLSDNTINLADMKVDLGE